MKTYELQELVDFAFAQPDNRPINMSEAHTIYPCGCLLVHFGKHKGFTKFGCGWTGVTSLFFVTDAHIVTRNLFFFKDKVKTYKDVKHYLRTLIELGTLPATIPSSSNDNVE